jgi:hypothetical protein
MKNKTIKGRFNKNIGNHGEGAIKALRNMKAILKKKGIDMDLFHGGTLNITLDEPFYCDEFFSLVVNNHELNSHPDVAKDLSPDGGEVWRFLKVTYINGEECAGWIYRTTHPTATVITSNERYGSHGPQVVELITATREIEHDDRIEITIYKGP